MGLDIYKYRLLEPKGDENTLSNNGEDSVCYVDEENLHLFPKWMRDRFIVSRKTEVHDWHATFQAYNKKFGTSHKFEDFEWLCTHYGDDCHIEFRNIKTKEEIKIDEQLWRFKFESRLCFYYDDNKLYYQRKNLENFYDFIYLHPEDDENYDLTDFGKISLGFDKETLRQFIPTELCREDWNAMVESFKEGEEFINFSW